MPPTRGRGRQSKAFRGGASGRKQSTTISSSSDDDVDAASHVGNGASMEEEYAGVADASGKAVKLSYQADQLVLLKEANGTIYYARIKSIDFIAHECEVVLDNDKTGTADFGNIYHVSHNLMSGENRLVCAVCHKKSSDSVNEVVVCDQCLTGFHQHCHAPAIPSQGRRQETATWLCAYCRSGKENPHARKADHPFRSRSRRVVAKRPGAAPEHKNEKRMGEVQQVGGRKRMSALMAVQKMQAQARQRTPPYDTENAYESEEEEEEAVMSSDNEDQDQDAFETMRSSDDGDDAATRGPGPRSTKRPRISGNASPVESVEFSGKRMFREPRIVLDPRHSRNRLTEEYATFHRDKAGVGVVAAGDQRPPPPPVGAARRAAGADGDVDGAKKQFNVTDGHVDATKRRLSTISDSSASDGGEPAFKPQPATTNGAPQAATAAAGTSHNGAGQPNRVLDEIPSAEGSMVDPAERSLTLATSSQSKMFPSKLNPTSSSLSRPPGTASKAAALSPTKQSASNQGMVSPTTAAKTSAATKHHALKAPARIQGRSYSDMGPRQKQPSSKPDPLQLAELRRSRHEQWLKAKQNPTETGSNGEPNGNGEAASQAATPDAPATDPEESGCGGKESVSDVEKEPPALPATTAARVPVINLTTDKADEEETGARHHHSSGHRHGHRKKRSSKELSAQFLEQMAACVKIGPRPAGSVNHFAAIRDDLQSHNQNLKYLLTSGAKGFAAVESSAGGWGEPFCANQDFYLSVAMAAVTADTDLSSLCGIFNAHHACLVAAATERQAWHHARRRATRPTTGEARASHGMGPTAANGQSPPKPGEAGKRSAGTYRAGQSTTPDPPTAAGHHRSSRQHPHPHAQPQPGQEETAIPKQLLVGNKLCGVQVDGKWFPVRETQERPSGGRATRDAGRAPRDDHYRRRSPGQQQQQQHEAPHHSRIAPATPAKRHVEMRQRQGAPPAGREVSAAPHLSVVVDPPLYRGRHGNAPPAAAAAAAAAPNADNLTAEQAKSVSEMYGRLQQQQQHHQQHQQQHHQQQQQNQQQHLRQMQQQQQQQQQQASNPQRSTDTSTNIHYLPGSEYRSGGVSVSASDRRSRSPLAQHHSQHPDRKRVSGYHDDESRQTMQQMGAAWNQEPVFVGDSPGQYETCARATHDDRAKHPEDGRRPARSYSPRYAAAPGGHHAHRYVQAAQDHAAAGPRPSSEGQYHHKQSRSRHHESPTAAPYPYQTSSAPHTSSNGAIRVPGATQQYEVQKARDPIILPNDSTEARHSGEKNPAGGGSGNAAPVDIKRESGMPASGAEQNRPITKQPLPRTGDAVASHVELRKPASEQKTPVVAVLGMQQQQQQQQQAANQALTLPPAAMVAAETGGFGGVKQELYGTCINCGKRAKWICSMCNNVWYCDVDCQRKSWKTHCQHCHERKESGSVEKK